MSPAHSAPGDGEVHVWGLRLPDRDDGTLAARELDERERARAAGFVRPGDRARYVSAHVALRRVLSSYLGLPAREVAFGRAPCPGCGGPHGRPVLTGPGATPHFSLSHSKDRAVIAVAAAPVGVDVQKVPPAPTAERCAPALHPREQTELAALPAGRRPEAFARLWARKEAYLKGIGTGLSRGPAADYLGEDARAHPTGWYLHDLPGHPAALALRSRVPPRTTLCTLPRPPYGGRHAEGN